MRETAGKMLLVFGGPKGSGKSTLLAHALKHKIPLFGDHIDPVFQRTSLPGTNEEFSLSTAEVLERGTWASGLHAADIAAMVRPPPHLVVHLDLMNFSNVKERAFESLRDTDANLAHMRSGAQAPIFSAYAAVYVATLMTDYDVCARWFNSRRYRAQRPTTPNEARLYSGDREGRDAFAAIRRAWDGFVWQLPNLAACAAIGYDEKRIAVGAPLMRSAAVPAAPSLTQPLPFANRDNAAQA